MFGYRIEQNFDLAKEQRRDRLMWIVGTGLCLLVVLDFTHPFSMIIFQGYFLTALSYGDSFYVQRKDKLRERWLWKAILATIPVHSVFLIAIVMLGKAFPRVSFNVGVWVPVFFLAFGIEDVLFDGIVDRMSRSS